MPILYGAPISPFVRKVAIVLEEKNLPFEWKPVRPHDRLEEFQAVSPLGKIPAYKDDKIALADSSVISFYLEKMHPENPLYPTDTIELVRALWFEEYFDGALFTPMSIVFQEKWMNPVLGKPVDHAAMREALEKTPPMLDYLESELKPDQWIVGNRFSIADISIAIGFMNLNLTDYTLDAARYPKMKAHVERALKRPSFQKCDAFLKGFIVKMKERLAAKGNH
jgi:glutathione S-transferase